MVHIHAEGPAFFCWIPKLFGKRVICTIHGLDWDREKWRGSVASKFIRGGEKNAVKYADEIIVLSKDVQKYFLETYGRKTHFIPNGVNRPEVREAKLITDHFGLKKDSYILFLGRLVPEKGIRYLVEAFKNVKTDKKLVIAGGSSDTDSFMEELKDLAKGDDRIFFTGFVQGAMGQIKVEKNVGGIEGLCVIEPAVHGDARGYFMETYNEKDMKEAGIDIHFVQDNQSMSTKGVLRGLHFQKQYPQCKLVRAVRGTVFDVAVDLRSDSTTYGKWYGVTLSAENKKQFLIPEGFAHGFLVLSNEAEFCYKVNDFWHPNDEGGMAWNDPEIGIEWPQLKGEYKGSASAEGYTLEDGTALNLSDKDQKWRGLKDTFKF